MISHSSDIWTASLTTDNSKIMTVSRDETVGLWDTNSGRLLKIIEGFPAAFFPDGSKVLIANKNEVSLVDTSTGETLATLSVHETNVTLLDFTPDKSKMVTISEDNNLRFWNLADFQLHASLTGLGDQTIKLVFSKDGSKFATGSKNGILTIWNLETLEPIYNVNSNSDLLNLISFSDDSSLVATASSSDKEQVIKVYKATEQKEVLRLEGHTGNLTAIKFSPKNKSILASSSGDRTVRLWDISNGKELLRLEHKDWINDFNLSPDGSKLAVAGLDMRIYLWEVSTGRLLSLLLGHSGQVRSVIFSPDGTRLISSSEDATVRVWDTPKVRKLSEPSSGVNDGNMTLAFSSDGTEFITGSLDGYVYLWDCSSGILKKTLKNFRNLFID